MLPRPGQVYKTRPFAGSFGKIGGFDGRRSHNILIKSQVLYQLSYEPEMVAAPGIAQGRSAYETKLAS